MSLHLFWTMVREAKRELAGGITVPPFSNARPGSEASRLNWWGLHLWLVPATVVDFDEADFDFLPAGQRSELAQLVQKFRETAAKVEDGGSLSDEALKEGRPLLERIIEILDFERYKDPDALRYGKRIERTLARDRPPEIVDMTFRTGPDYADSPTLWIDVALADKVFVEDSQFLEVARRVDQRLDRIARHEAPHLWPFISMRAASKQAASAAMV